MKQTILLLIIAGMVGCKDFKGFRGEGYSEDTIRAEDLRGAFVADSNIIVLRGHVCLYNPCPNPHIIKDTLPSQ